jgi:drug/metabolite transporter (DMT)-like permease
MKSAKFNKKVYVFVAGSALIFATMAVALKLAGGNLDPFQITFLRFLIGGIVLLPFAIKEYLGHPKGYMTGRLWLSMLLLGAVNVPFCMILFQLGVMHSNAATAAVIFCSNPIFTMPFAHLMTKDDKMNRNKMLAILLGAIGLIFMIRPWDIQEGNSLAGALFSLSGAVVFGFYGVLGGRTVGRVGVFTQTSVSFLFGALILLCLLPPLGRPILEGAADNIALILYVSIVVTGGGYLFYFLAMKSSNPTTASITFFLKPVIAPIFAVIILKETITYNMYIGIALILAASYILSFRRQR